MQTAFIVVVICSVLGVVLVACGFLIHRSGWGGGIADRRNGGSECGSGAGADESSQHHWNAGDSGNSSGGGSV